jgi:hypothetical protein
VQTTLLARATSGRTVTPPTTIVRSDKDLQDALDTFMDYSTERYRVLGTEVDVKVGFRMTPPGNLREKDKMTAKADAELSAAARALKMDRAVVGLLVSGRATPGQIHLITQQLLDMGCQPSVPCSEPKEFVRQIMVDHHIGLDCAGFVQQAFLLAMGLSRSQAHFKEANDENLSTLRSKGFTSVTPPQARPGDIICLGPLPPPPGQRQLPGAVGHRIIVYERRPPTHEELKTFRAYAEAQQLPPIGEHVTVLECLSSWGNMRNGQVIAMRGGVQRAILLHDPDTNVWGTFKPDYHNAEVGLPYHHTFEGIFRWKQ